MTNRTATSPPRTTTKRLASAIFALLAGITAVQSEPPTAAGELGADLAYLAACHTPPRHPGESNHFIDLWAGGHLKEIAALHGLVDNRALIVNSHGRGRTIRGRAGYTFYPHASRLAPGQPTPYYTAADLARILGPDQAARIHNLVLAGCDFEGALQTRELRKHFVNATNIIRVAPGKGGYQEMFFQALTRPSSDIQPLYEVARKNAVGQWEYHIETTPARKATQLVPYIAELFEPGAAKPYRIQTAGRELLVSRPGAPELAVASTRRAPPGFSSE